MEIRQSHYTATTPTAHIVTNDSMRQWLKQQVQRRDGASLSTLSCGRAYRAATDNKITSEADEERKAFIATTIE